MELTMSKASLEKSRYKRVLQRSFRRHAIALCKANGMDMPNAPKTVDLIGMGLGFLGLAKSANKTENMLLIVEAVSKQKIVKPISRKKPVRVVGDFYLSREWRELRYEALVKNNGKCECCGAGKHTGAVLHVDHIYPRSLFPDKELDLDNLQILCSECNMGKSNKDFTDWRHSEI
jgi:hypothetical protein